MKSVKLLLLGFALLNISACLDSENSGDGNGASKQTPLRIIGERSFLDGYAPVNADGTINVVVEIPAGTNAKWEVCNPDGAMEWELVNGRPRIVNYLPYPGNYGK